MAAWRHRARTLDASDSQLKLVVRTFLVLLVPAYLGRRLLYLLYVRWAVYRGPAVRAQRSSGSGQCARAWVCVCAARASCAAAPGGPRAPQTGPLRCVARVGRRARVSV